jgi:hypothetical protein
MSDVIGYLTVYVTALVMGGFLGAAIVTHRHHAGSPPKTPKTGVNAQGLPSPRPPDKKGNQPTIPANPYPPRPTDSKGHQPKYPVGHNAPPKTPKVCGGYIGEAHSLSSTPPTTPSSIGVVTDTSLSDADIERIYRALAMRLLTEEAMTGPSLLDGIRDRSVQA